MSRQRDVKYDLLEIIHLQEKIIAKQDEAISKLVNESCEQESLIGALIEEMGPEA